MQCLVPKINVLYQGTIVSGFSSRCRKLWKTFEFFIPQRQWKEMDHSEIKVLRISLLQEIKQIEWKNTQKRKWQKIKESRTQFVAEELVMVTQVGRLVYSAPEVVEVDIVFIFRWRRKEVRTCRKLNPNCYHYYHKWKCSQPCRISCIWCLLL